MKNAWNLEEIKSASSTVVSSSSQRKRLYDDVLYNIEVKLKSNDERDLAYLGAYLRWLSVWEAHNGLVECMEGRMHGWERIEKSAQFLYWHIKLMVYLYDHDNHPQKTARVTRNEGARCLAHLLATESREDQVRWLGSRLGKSFDDGALGKWPGTPFEPFMAQLFMAWSGEIIPQFPAPQLGVYQIVFNAWNENETTFAQAIHVACSYHLANATSNDGYPEFAYPLYDAYPAEILALRRVRRDAKLSWPPVVHPLLNSPLAYPPISTPSVHDPIIAAVVSKAKSVWRDL